MLRDVVEGKAGIEDATLFMEIKWVLGTAATPMFAYTVLTRRTRGNTKQ